MLSHVACKVNAKTNVPVSTLIEATNTTYTGGDSFESPPLKHLQMSNREVKMWDQRPLGSPVTSSYHSY